jgi:hypothetical protein
MTWLTESDVRGTLTRTALAAAIAGAAMIGATVPANAQDDPACEMLGWNIDGTLSLPGTPGAT